MKGLWFVMDHLGNVYARSEDYEEIVEEWLMCIAEHEPVHIEYKVVYDDEEY